MDGCKHLRVEDVLEYISIKELTKENEDRLLWINSHIQRCKDCHEKVNLYYKLKNTFEKWDPLEHGLIINPFKVNLNNKVKS